MKTSCLRLSILRGVCISFVLPFLLQPFLRAQPGPAGLRIVFMEPDSAHEAGPLPAFRVVTDETRLRMYRAWIDNDAARWAFDLYRRAWTIERRHEPELPADAAYYVALVPGGNNAAVGFRLYENMAVQSYPRATYIKLAPDDWLFDSTLLHETGHMLLAMLNGGREVPKREIAPISHTTAALTDRGTAFDEGFAIHLETLAAHFLQGPVIKDRYDHQRFMFGAPSMLGEYHRPAADLLSFSQTRARYFEVRENSFAFSPAFKGPDYLRVEMEKARDMASLRDANQLLQAEGFMASFFFGFLLRGDRPVGMDVVSQRQTEMLETLAAMFSAEEKSAESPFLLDFVRAFMKKYPGEAKEALDVLLDLSHGVFVDRTAPKLWRDHYLNALRLDLKEKNNKEIEAARDRWRSEALKNPNALYSLVGPQIRCEVAERSVLLVAFEESAPLSFDLNTVEEGVMRMLPGISADEVESWLTQRAAKSFRDAGDFMKRGGLSAVTLQHLKFGA